MNDSIYDILLSPIVINEDCPALYILLVVRT